MPLVDPPAWSHDDGCSPLAPTPCVDPYQTMPSEDEPVPGYYDPLPPYYEGNTMPSELQMEGIMNGELSMESLLDGELSIETLMDGVLSGDESSFDEEMTLPQSSPPPSPTYKDLTPTEEDDAPGEEDTSPLGVEEYQEYLSKP
ncbi:Uu.00g076250.m01.CDS01 [Anthostomella pinea]|uniref:Uu.00g076250.m01.CDS01 n=1 Tax=Anthostomella pinea TaxID=933095 RepID=A0AAI8VWQ5_9PEZI|nr:Uu.00g076250.m01.CDS01 [Anthostomella pinea]